MTTLGWFKRKLFVVQCLIVVAALGVLGWWILNQPITAPDAGQLGGPVDGLTAIQLKKFYDAKELFKHQFTMEEGLGPLFNGKSCFECHGQPGVVGGEGRDTSSTSIVVFARRVRGTEKANKPLKEVIQGLTKPDVDFFLLHGGPTLQRKSLSTEFPDKFPFETQLNFEQIPIEAELQSNRHSPPLFGAGLVDNIPEGDMVYKALQQAEKCPRLAGNPISAVDRYTELPRASRFGWKDQHVNLVNFTAGALSLEMGITTYLHHTENTPSYLGLLPPDFASRMPRHGGPDDRGKVLVTLTYFQSLLAPPPRGEITAEVNEGEKVFKKLQCAVCHLPEARTVANAKVPDPDSPIPSINYIPIAALSNKTFYPYSDFLVHDMGPDLADGIPQEGAKGGEFRSTPLWGLRFKKFYLHDGRTQDLNEAILLHGGQATGVRDAYKQLSPGDHQALMAFLKSL